MKPTLSEEETPDEVTRFYRFLLNRGDRAKSTAQKYRSNLRKWSLYCQEEGVDLTDPKPREVEDFFFIYLSDYADETLTSFRSALSKFFKRKGDRSVEETPLDRADIGSWSAKSEKSENSEEDINYLSESEVGKLIDNVPEPELRNQLICRLMLQTGMRASECATVRLDDIDQTSRRIMVRDHKSDDTRVAYYKASLDTLMSLWIETERQTVYKSEQSDYLFPTKNSDHITAQRINTVVRNAAENAGIQETYMVANDEGRDTTSEEAKRKRHTVTSHVLRHTFATHAYDDGDGMDIHLIQEILGHEDVQTTIDLYVHEDEEAIRKGIKKHGPSF